MARISWENIDRAVNDFGKAVVKQARRNLSKEKANATRKLYNSIGYKFKDRVLIFTMLPYGAFLDKGVTGTGKLYFADGNFRPVAFNKSDARPQYRFRKKVIGGRRPVRKWMQIRNIPVSDFVIRRSISAKGIRPRRFFTSAYDKQFDQFEEELSRVLTLDVEENLDQILSAFKN
jgi:hypothetical protein